MLAGIMIDFETLGLSPSTVVMSSGVVINPCTGGSDLMFKEFIFNTWEQTNNRVVDKQTLTWLVVLSRIDMFCEFIRKGSNTFKDMLSWIDGKLFDLGINHKNVEIWSNGADFDIKILVSIYKDGKREYPFKYYNHRCFRTLFNLYKNIIELKSFTGTKHNPIDDSLNQEEFVKNVFSHINKCS